MERTNPTNAIPRIRFKGSFSFSLITLHEARHEKLVGQGVKFDATSLTVPDLLVVVIESDNLGDCTRLGCKVGDFVVIRRCDWLATGKSHERVAIRRCHVDTALFCRPAE